MLSRFTCIRPVTTNLRRLKSTSTPSSSCHPLKGDEGSLATHVHHKVTTALALLAPVYFLIPSDTSSSSFAITIPKQVDQGAGILISALISVHSWISLNYVVSDYIPKLSKSLVGPARIVSAGMALVTMIGLSKISFQNDKGLRGLVDGLWTPKKKDE
jgi:succinate dehydrogenase hydrophobic anchor subunit